MISNLRDLPFFESLAPVLIACVTWLGLHILYVGPEVVAPRLAENVHRHQCMVQVNKALTIFADTLEVEVRRRIGLQAEADRRTATARTKAEADHKAARRKAEQLTRQAAEAERQARQIERNAGAFVIGTIVSELLGKEEGRAAGNLARLAGELSDSFDKVTGKGAAKVADIAQRAPIHIPREVLKFAPLPTFGVPDDYCGCVINEAFADPVMTGLYSASLRLWKPAVIRRLDGFETGLIPSASCGLTELPEH